MTINKVMIGVASGLLFLSLNSYAMPAPPPPPQPVPPGGYSTQAVTDPQIKEVAAFAAKELSKSRATVKTIHQAATQVVAGVNYRLDITLSDGKRYEVVVFKSLDHRYQLTSTKPIGTTKAKTLDDPLAYCAAVKNIDHPDARYTGDLLPKVVIKALNLDKDAEKMALENPGFVTWRCMGQKVWACTVGANIPCDEKADTRRTPNAAMKTFCKANPDTDSIPSVATGKSTVYEWRCKAGKPKIVSQLTPVDARGYAAANWILVK